MVNEVETTEKLWLVEVDIDHKNQRAAVSAVRPMGEWIPIGTPYVKVAGCEDEIAAFNEARRVLHRLNIFIYD